MVHPFFRDGRITGSLSLDRYMQVMTDRADAPVDGLSAEDAERVAFTKLNLHRSLRIGRTHRVDDQLSGLVKGLTAPTVWMVITEPWCGDSAQCLPYITLFTQLNPAIDLRLVLRDESLDIMDAFLTDGKRSIPRLVIFTADGRELAQWGPRPAKAQAVFDAAKAAGDDKPRLLEKLHLWYGRDRGAALTTEFIALLKDMPRP